MTMSLPASAFEPSRQQRAQRQGGERATGIAITIAAHLVAAAALIYGVEVARAPMAEMPITIDIVKEEKKPEPKPAAPPKLAPPVEVSVPPPLIEIAPPPQANAITATPPRPPALPQAAPPAPAPVEAPGWNGEVSYYASLLATLERFKQYPAAARAAHIEGQVFVHFVMRRDGTVLSAEIARSSGRPALDREALAMIARAGTLPPMPAEMKGETLNGVIGPITFALH
jgi:protein TonB